MSNPWDPQQGANADSPWGDQPVNPPPPAGNYNPQYGVPGQQPAPQPPYGQAPNPYGAQPYPQQQQPPYGAPYGQPPQGQPYGQAPYGQAPYVPAYGQPPYGPPPRKRTGLWIGIGAFVVIAAIALTLGLTLGLSGDSGSSDEAKIRQVSQDLVDGVNSGNPTTLAKAVCQQSGAEVLTDIGSVNASHVALLKVEDIKVSGDSATARVTLAIEGQTGALDVTYAKESSAWKVCGIDYADVSIPSY